MGKYEPKVIFEDPVTLSVDGSPLKAYRGQTIAAVLNACGKRVVRTTRVNGRPRGFYCGIGVCFDCVVKVDGVVVRACMTCVEEGMEVTRLSRSNGTAAER